MYRMFVTWLDVTTVSQELVLETFREMQLFGLAPDGFAINHCLQACDITEEYDAAANVIRGLWKMGTPVEDRTYTVAFSVLARGCHVKVWGMRLVSSRVGRSQVLFVRRKLWQKTTLEVHASKCGT